MAARAAVLGVALLIVGCASQPRPDRFAGGPSPDRRGPPLGRSAPPGMARGRLFISPMGEPFRGDESNVAPAAAWFGGADADHDGRLARAEFTADAMRFFALLDVDHDGEIGPGEIDRYEQVVAPEIGVGIGGGGGFGGGGERSGGGRGGRGSRGGRGGGGGPPGGGRGPGRDGPPDGGSAGGSSASGPGAGEPLQGAGRFGYLAAPEPVSAADADLNRGVTRPEFQAAALRRFALLDRDGDGALTEAELPRLGGGPRRPPPRSVP